MLIKKALYLLGPVALVFALVLGLATSKEALAGKDLGNGMKCTFDSDCASRHCSFKVCKAKGGGTKKNLANGVACTFDSDCESRHCSFKVCKAKSGSSGKQLGNGAACTFNSDCESKNCSFKVCKKR
ncbi:MAG: hypothetical protein KF773_04020 [Deltaproteobacteria bacterium]|nr:hypothetical protein [Deltaproteobacteria bacterium]MCW5801444.1 hypothetical protein [Deltaproteobacteria bacterium]